MASFLGLATYGFGLASSTLGLIQNGQRWSQAAIVGNKGALLGASSMVVSDIGSAGFNYWAFRTTLPAVRAALKSSSSARAAIWASNAASVRQVFFVTTAAFFALGILALGGEYLYNYHSRTELELWLEEGPWGNLNKNRSLDEEQLRLERISSIPNVALVPVSGASDGRCAELRISFPLISADSLQSLSAEFTASWLTERLANEWQHYAETILAQLSLTSASNAPLRLRFPIYPNEANADHGLLVGLRYRPGYPFQIRDGKQEYLFELMGFASHRPQLWGGAPKVITRKLQPVKIGRMRLSPQWRPISLHDLILDNEQA